jgi:hypothetical protein
VIVTGTWLGLTRESGVASATDIAGIALFKSNQVRCPQGEFCFEVTGLAHPDYVHDPSGDVYEGIPPICGPTLN